MAGVGAEYGFTPNWSFALEYNHLFMGSRNVGITFLLVTLGWVFFRSDTFEHAGQWFGALVGANGLGRGWSPETGALLGLVLIGLAIVRGFPNSLEMDLERIGPVPQTGLAFATVAAIFLMNYRSKFLYFQF